MRLTLFFIILSSAAIIDIRKRMIPDWLVVMLAGVSLLPPEPIYGVGILAALPLFIAGITVGGIGGGDVKLTAACGLVLGFERTFTGLIMSLCLLLAFHTARNFINRIKNRTCKSGTEQAYPLVPFLMFGMLLSIWNGGNT